MGPILDNKGLEQGGLGSSDLYKIYSNEQSMTAQKSGLGVNVHDHTVSLIALADDAALVSDNIIFLKHLLYLTTQYCNKYGVELVVDKTKLLAFSSQENIPWVKYAELTSQVELYGHRIPFSNEAEHLGVLRTNTPSNNMPNILVRLQEHNKKLFSILPAGLGLGHHANPAACVRAEQIYALPVLLSGLSALVLRRAEVNMIAACYKNTLQRLMKLRERTPDCAVFFLAGSLPCQAVLHLRQLSLFLMICHLKEDILQNQRSLNPNLRPTPGSRKSENCVFNTSYLIQLLFLILHHLNLSLKNSAKKKFLISGMPDLHQKLHHCPHSTIFGLNTCHLHLRIQSLHL